MKRKKSVSPVVSTSGFSLIDAATVITGDLETSGSLRIDGRMEGSVTRADVVVLGVGSTMTGDIRAREIVIGGTLTGTVHAVERVELQATAIVTGDLVSQSVLIQEGGVVNGRVLMQPPATASAPPAPLSRTSDKPSRELVATAPDAAPARR